jgi:hypothetical protein
MNRKGIFTAVGTLTGTVKWLRKPWLTRTQKTVLTEALLILLVTMVIAIISSCGPAKQVYNASRDDEQDARLRDIEQRIGNITVAYRALEQRFVFLEEQADATDADLEETQQAANLALAQLAGLQSNVQIYAIVDLCGDGVGMDEVALKTSKGWLVYFEAGTTRALSLLPPGQYQTTDKQKCEFSVNNDGTITHNGVTQ